MRAETMLREAMETTVDAAEERIARAATIVLAFSVLLAAALFVAAVFTDARASAPETAGDRGGFAASLETQAAR